MPEELDPVSNRLDAVLRLLLEFIHEEQETKIGDLILILQSSGLKRAEIAKILGKDVTSIPSLVADADNDQLRNKMKKKQ